MYCPICNEYKGFMGEVCEPCEKIKKIVELYSNEKVLGVLETTLLRSTTQIDKKLDFLKEKKDEKKN